MAKSKNKTMCPNCGFTFDPESPDRFDSMGTTGIDSQRYSHDPEAQAYIEAEKKRNKVKKRKV